MLFSNPLLDEKVGASYINHFRGSHHGSVYGCSFNSVLILITFDELNRL